MKTRLLLVALALVFAPLPAAAQSVCLSDEADLFRRVHVTAQTCRADWQPKIGAEPYARLEQRRERLNEKLLAQALVNHPDTPRGELVARIDCITSDCRNKVAPPVNCETGSALGDLALLQDWTRTDMPQRSEPVFTVDPDRMKPRPLPLSSTGLESPVANLITGEQLKQALENIDTDTYAVRCKLPDIRKRTVMDSEELLTLYDGQPVPWDVPDRLGTEQWVVTCGPHGQDTRWLRVSWQISECNGDQLGFDTELWYYDAVPWWAHDLPWASTGMVIPGTRAQVVYQLYFGIFDISQEEAEFLPAPAR